MKKRVYMIGIKGVAMTAMSIFLKQAGYEVEGSDVQEIYPTDEILNRNGIRIKKGFSQKNIQGKYKYIVATGAHGGRENLEAVYASKRGDTVYMHGQMLGKLMEGKKGISVAGCHGKTTISSMISSILTHAGADPSYCVGTAYINGIGPGGHYGKSDYFVAEADEYMTCPKTDRSPRFSWQFPEIAVISNIEFDHPDFFKDIEDVKNAFGVFISNISMKGKLIYCADDPKISELIKRKDLQVYSYGFSKNADFRISDYRFSNGFSMMRIEKNGKKILDFKINLSGKHNLLNSLASIIACWLTGLDFKIISKAILNYTGSNRRFELIYKRNDIYLYDDYAHHPSEIISTIDAFRDWYKDYKLIVLFQPHTYSRTKILLNEFSKAFTGADLLILPDIFPSARELQDPSINSKILSDKVNEIRRISFYAADSQDAMEILTNTLKQKTVIVTMGAGNLYLWHEKIKGIMNNFSYEG